MEFVGESLFMEKIVSSWIELYLSAYKKQGMKIF